MIKNGQVEVSKEEKEKLWDLHKFSCYEFIILFVQMIRGLKVHGHVSEIFLLHIYRRKKYSFSSF